MARELRKTVDELLLGHPVPLSNDEYQNWAALHLLEAEEAKRENDKARRGGRWKAGRRR